MFDFIATMLNSSRFFAACVMIMMNIGGRYISKDIPDYIFNIFEFPIVRAITVFCIAFIASRDVKISLIIALFFVILFKYLLDNKSNVCLLPEKVINALDINKDGVISEAELKKAGEVIEKYRRQKTKNNINKPTE